MNKGKINNPKSNQFILISSEFMDEIKNKQEKIISYLESLTTNKKNSHEIHKKFISQNEAKKILNKGDTWMWQQRNSGKLKYKKVGKNIYYDVNEINNFINNADDENE